MDEKVLEKVLEKVIEYATAFVASSYSNKVGIRRCREILEGDNPAVMAALVAVRICREDHDSGMAEDFIELLDSQTG